MGKQGIKDFKVLEPSNIVRELLHDIDNELPKFTDSEEFVEILAKKRNENQHSLAFCLFMNKRCENFLFMTENPQLGNRTVDIGVYKGTVLFFTIEAKLLPTPESTVRNEYEYVYGKGGGIQRFKDGNHGVDNRDNLISTNGLIAYLKENDFKYWYRKINQWILDAKWNEDEQLEIINFNSIAKLKSEHVRKANSSVSLFHFWINVSGNQL